MTGTSSIELPTTFALGGTDECTIRAMREDDASELCTLLPKMHAESQWLNYMPGEFDKDEQWERNFIHEQQTKHASILLVAEAKGAIVAIAGAGSPEFKRYAHHAELGLSILKDFWGKGLGRKLMNLLIEWGRTCNLHKMYLKVFDGNERAIGLYRSMGFNVEARLKDDFAKNDGNYGDTLIMSFYYK